MTIKLFGADWCQPCQQLKKLLVELKEDYNGLEYDTIDVDSNPEEVNKYRVRGVPTLIKLGEDGSVVGSLVGAQTKNTLKDFLEVV